MRYCECGCGQVVKNRFVSGHNLRGKRVFSKEHCKKISESAKERYKDKRNCPNFGKTFSKEHCEKISSSQKNKVLTIEHRGKISQSHKGKSLSKQHIRAISNSAKGHVKSPQHCKALSESLKGRKLSESHVKKLSESHTGSKQSEEVKIKRGIYRRGEDSPFWKGRKIIRCVACKKEIAVPINSEQITCDSKCFGTYMSIKYLGESNPSWNGGSSFEPYCIEWTKDLKEFVKCRDGYQCQNPGCWGNCTHLPLHIHHIDYVKKNCHSNNLITLCISCNTRANYNRKYWQGFYGKLMKKEG